MELEMRWLTALSWEGTARLTDEQKQILNDFLARSEEALKILSGKELKMMMKMCPPGS